METAENIVLAIDGSEHSERAMQFYLDNLYRKGQVVHLVHALEYPYIPAQPYVNKEVIQQLIHTVIKEGQKVEEKVEKVLRHEKIEFKLHSAFAKPGEYICKVAQDQNAVMICMGTRGLGTIRRTIMGSVSDYVVHHAHCPVVIARK